MFTIAASDQCNYLIFFDLISPRASEECFPIWGELSSEYWLGLRLGCSKPSFRVSLTRRLALNSCWRLNALRSHSQLTKTTPTGKNSDGQHCFYALKASSYKIVNDHVDGQVCFSVKE